MAWSLAVYLLLATRLDARSALLPGKNIISIIPKLIRHSEPTPANISAVWEAVTVVNTVTNNEELTPDPHFTVEHAGLPRSLSVYPLAVSEAYHELKFNVSWEHSLGTPASDYSIEIHSVTDTVDCRAPMCYEYNIPGDAWWWVVPAVSNPVAETCAVRPGCSYSVRLIAHPWDGHTAANLLVELDECVAGVCSCAHSPRLPTPTVSAHTVSIDGELFVNVSWVTPPPQYPQRLPPGLEKRRYTVSIGKQMVSNAHPAPWFANTVSRSLETSGAISDSDGAKWKLLPVTERSDPRAKERKPKQIVLDVRLLARVSLVDDRGCVGPAGTVTAYDPVEATKTSITTYLLWAALGGVCVMIMGALLAAGAHLVKRVLTAFRSAPVSATGESRSRRPAWFPLQLRSSYKCLSESNPQTSPQVDFRPLRQERSY